MNQFVSREIIHKQNGTRHKKEITERVWRLRVFLIHFFPLFLVIRKSNFFPSIRFVFLMENFSLISYARDGIIIIILCSTLRRD